MSTRKSKARRNVARTVTAGAAVVVCCGVVAPAAYADTTVSVPYTVYVDDAGVAEGAATTATVGLHDAGEPVITVADVGMDTARDDGDGGSAVCTPYVTRPHATPRSPRDGDIYVEGEAHVECASTRVEVSFVAAIEWRLDNNYGTSGPHYQQAGSASCSGASRCPRSGDVIAPWGHVSRCHETGTYSVTTVILSGSYTYRNKRYNLGGARSATMSGTYGKGC